jgi:hypothetical protein
VLARIDSLVHEQKDDETPSKPGTCEFPAPILLVRMFAAYFPRRLHRTVPPNLIPSYCRPDCGRRPNSDVLARERERVGFHDDQRHNRCRRRVHVRFDVWHSDRRQRQ